MASLSFRQTLRMGTIPAPMPDASLKAVWRHVIEADLAAAAIYRAKLHHLSPAHCSPSSHQRC
jgi:hypothetical protein